MSGIVLPKEFAYPAATAVSAFWLLVWQMMRVGGARRQAKIAYPQVYAEKAEAAASKDAQKFNCTQRAHQNTLEQIPLVVGSTLLAGVAYPVAAASLCGTWVAMRVLYTIGYSTGEPTKRNMIGSNYISLLSSFGLVGLSTATVVSWIRSL